MTLVAAAQSTFAIAIVAVLLAVFVMLLVGSFIRARRATRTVAAAGERPAAAPRPGTTATATATAGGGGGGGRAVVSRRDFFRGGLLASLGVFAAQFGGASLAFLWPNLKGGFGSVITLPDTADSIRDQIRTNRQPYYFGAGRFYIVQYNADDPEGIYEGVASGGLMALYQKCVHLGCRVPFCEQSQWFECPCHGSKYNGAGEYEDGPAPTGLNRFRLTVEGDNVRVDTSAIVPGPPRGVDTVNQAPQGPFCV